MKSAHASQRRWFFRFLASRRGLLVVVLLVALPGLLIVGWVRGSFTLRKSQVTSGLEALAAAYKGRRPLEARVSGQSYAPFISLRGEAHHPDELAQDRAEKLLLEADNEQSNAASQQALGKFHLMAGSPSKASLYFERALKENPDDSSLHSDYGVALLELSQMAAPDESSDNTLQYLARSLEQTEIALRLNSNSLEALHNRALVLDRLKLPEQRDKAWQVYLRRETDPSWSAEASRRLETIPEINAPTSSRVVDQFLSTAMAHDSERGWLELTRNKEMITEQYIPQALASAFLTATGNGDSKQANRLLEAMRFAGNLEHENAQDPFLAELAAYYARSTPRQQEILRAAHGFLNRGYLACLNADYDDANFIEARKLFLSAGDTWEAKICDYWIAYCLSSRDQYSKSNELLESLAEFSRARQYHWLEGQATCWIANNYTDLSEYSKSIETYEHALATAKEIGDVYNQQKILSQWGNIYQRLNQPERALQYDWRALHLVDRNSSSVRQTWRIYLYTARALIALNLLNAAKAYEEEMLSLALNVIKDPAVSHYSYFYLAQIESGKKNFGEALQFASHSLDLADSVSDQKNRHKLRTGALLLKAQLQRQSGAIAEALKTYDEVVENYRGMELRLNKLDAYKGRLLCYLALRDAGNFEAQLPTILAEFETYRQRIREEENRNTFFDLQQSIYDLAINHAIETQDSVSALNYSEESRARSLLQALKQQSVNTGVAAKPSLDVVEIQRRLSADLQVLQYAVLDDKLVVWLITSNSVTARVKEIGAGELRLLVSQYVDGITTNPGQADKVRHLSQQLYDLLIGPFANELDPRKVLCVVPDKTLSYVPFAALISSRSGKYLVSEYLLFTSPSLNVLLQCSENVKTQANQRSESLLAIGNPEFDRTAYPDLDDLPAADREARGIAAKYPGAHQLIGPDAIKTTIARRLPTADLVHFAGHYVTNQRRPLLSRLVLAKQGGTTDNDLTVRELLDMRLPRTKLVVLSACETSGKDYYNGEGLIGIARTFLQLGIPLVVASQWSVESESTAQLMLKFHENRRAGQSSIEALHNAQLAMLTDHQGAFSDPYYWAAFTPLGGYVNF